MQRGPPLLVMKEQDGWKEIEMRLKYARLHPDRLSHHANAVAFWWRQFDGSSFWPQQGAQKNRRPGRFYFFGFIFLIALFF